MDAINKLMKQMEKKYGEGALIQSKNDAPSNIERIPVSSPKIGDILGRGGIPRGKFIELYGPESAGKTSLACYLSGQVQQWTNEAKDRKGQVAFIDAEHALDFEYAATFGFNVSEALIAQPDSGEQALNISLDLVESGAVDFIVVDSVAALTPQAELEGEMGDMQMGAQARMMGKGIRKLTAAMSDSKCTILFLNQIRMTMGGYGNPECVTPDTPVNISLENRITVEDLFGQAGIDWRKMEIGESRDISDKSISVLSYNEKTEMVESKKVLSVVRKQYAPTYYMQHIKTDIDEDGTTVNSLEIGPTIFKSSGNHKIYQPSKGDFIKMSELEFSTPDLLYLFEDGDLGWVETYVEKTGLIEPILDFQVEDNSNYFANGVLSHNTTPGGKALKFASSIRLEIRKIEFMNEKNEIIGLRSRLKGVKNKTAPPMKKHEVEIFFGRGFDTYLEWVDFAIQYDVIVQSGAWFSVPNVESRFQGKHRVVDHLKENPKEYNSIIEETKKRMYPVVKKEDRVKVEETSSDEKENEDKDENNED